MLLEFVKGLSQYCVLEKANRGEMMLVQVFPDQVSLCLPRT